MKKKRKESQANKVKKYLEAGNSITPIDALKMFGSFRLAAIICNLRKDREFMSDKKIETTMVENEFGVKFASYTLKQKMFNEFEIKKIVEHNNKRMLELIE